MLYVLCSGEISPGIPLAQLLAEPTFLYFLVESPPAAVADLQNRRTSLPPKLSRFEFEVNTDKILRQQLQYRWHSK